MPQNILWSSLRAILVLLLLIAAVVLLLSYTKTDEERISYTKYYDDCKTLNSVQCSEEVDLTTRPCICFIDIHVKEPMTGSVGLYYELETFDQTRSDYVDSKDAKQLSGILSPTPAKSCGNYSYDDQNTPIAPCGAIADTMFTDDFDLIYQKNYVQCLRTDLFGISADDKKLYKNPPGNLTEAFKNFAKPKSWNKNIWELDIRNTSNNGFQNEAFIAWMKTDLKRKPYCHIENKGVFENGLPAGVYTLRVAYTYPYSFYQGARILTIESSKIVTRYYVGYLVTGILCLILVVVFITVEIARKYWINKWKCFDVV